MTFLSKGVEHFGISVASVATSDTRIFEQESLCAYLSVQYVGFPLPTHMYYALFGVSGSGNYPGQVWDGMSHIVNAHFVIQLHGTRPGAVSVRFRHRSRRRDIIVLPQYHDI